SPLLIVGMILLIAYLAKINDNEARVVCVLDQSGYFENGLKTTQNISFVHFGDIALETAKDSTMALAYYGLLHIPSARDMEAVAQRIQFFTEDNPNTVLIQQLEDLLQKQLRQDRLEKLGISPQEFSQVEKPFGIRLSTFEGERSLKGINEIKALIGGGFGYAIMMFIIIYGGFVMRSV